MDPTKADLIEKIEGDTYIVPSSDRNNIMCVIDARIDYCTCVSGKMGGFCKHQFLLMQHLNLTNAPCTSSLDRFSWTKFWSWCSFWFYFGIELRLCQTFYMVLKNINYWDGKSKDYLRLGSLQMLFHRLLRTVFLTPLNSNQHLNID